MWIVIASGLTIWLVMKKVKPIARIPAVIVILVIASMGTFTVVRYSGVSRTEIAPNVDLVAYNSIATSPFTILKIQNWSSHQFIYQTLLGGSDGILLQESLPTDDQSEFMNLELYRSVAMVCLTGIAFVLSIIFLFEFIPFIRKLK